MGPRITLRGGRCRIMYVKTSTTNVVVFLSRTTLDRPRRCAGYPPTRSMRPHHRTRTRWRRRVRHQTGLVRRSRSSDRSTAPPPLRGADLRDRVNQPSLDAQRYTLPGYANGVPQTVGDAPRTGERGDPSTPITPVSADRDWRRGTRRSAVSHSTSEVGRPCGDAQIRIRGRTNRPAVRADTLRRAGGLRRTGAATAGVGHHRASVGGGGVVPRVGRLVGVDAPRGVPPVPSLERWHGPHQTTPSPLAGSSSVPMTSRAGAQRDSGIVTPPIEEKTMVSVGILSPQRRAALL